MNGGIIFLNLQPIAYVSHRTWSVRQATHPANVRCLVFSLTCGTECEQTNDGHTPRVCWLAEERERSAKHGLQEIWRQCEVGHMLIKLVLLLLVVPYSWRDTNVLALCN
jgi:hypothetical protein